VTLFETASELRLQLEAASTADTKDELLARGQTVRSDIASAAEYLEAVQSYRVAIGRTDAPRLDTSAIRQAIGRFRGALSKSGPKALQQQSAATLHDVVTDQIRRVDRWARSTWRENFAAVEELLERANSADLHGTTTDKVRAQNRARTLGVVRNLDPIRERSELEAHLKTRGLGACIEQVNRLIQELREVIADIDRDHARRPPEVQAAIQRATSPGGLPLSEVTPELMAALRSAGVLDTFVVRRS